LTAKVEPGGQPHHILHRSVAFQQRRTTASREVDMSQIPSVSPLPNPLVNPQQGYGLQQFTTTGVLGGRVLAYLVDLVVVFFLWAIFVTVLTVLGFVTFGLAWLLIAPLFPIVAVLYSGLTISGPSRGTIGMRMAGVQMQNTERQPVPFVVAAVHAIFFYVSVSMLTPLVLLFGLFRGDRRLLHDLLAGLVAVRRA